MAAETLGTGSFSSVYKVGSVTAIKFFYYHQHSYGLRGITFLPEFDILRRIRHPYVMPALEVQTSDRGYGYTMPLGFTNLANIAYLTTLTLQQRCIIITKVITAVAHLHANGIIHLDIKPDNIVMIRDWRGCHQPLVADYSLARYYTEGQEETPTREAFALFYRAPEHLAEEKCVYRPSSDVWALGMTIYYILRGRHLIDEVLGAPPDYTVTAMDVNRTIFHADCAQKLEMIPLEMREVCTMMLQTSRTKRITMKDALGHANITPFLVEVGKDMPTSRSHPAPVPHPISGSHPAPVPHPISGSHPTPVPHPISGSHPTPVPHPISGSHPTPVPHATIARPAVCPPTSPTPARPVSPIDSHLCTVPLSVAEAITYDTISPAEKELISAFLISNQSRHISPTLHSTDKWQVGVKVITTLSFNAHSDKSLEHLFLAIHLFDRTMSIGGADICLHALTCLWMAQKLHFVDEWTLPLTGIKSGTGVSLYQASVIRLELKMLLYLQGDLCAFPVYLFGRCTDLDECLRLLREVCPRRDHYRHYKRPVVESKASGEEAKSKYTKIRDLPAGIQL